MNWRLCTRHDWVSNSRWWIQALFCILQLVCRSLCQSVLQTCIWLLTARCVSDIMSQLPRQHIKFWGKEKSSMPPEQRTAVVVFSGLQGWLDKGWEALVIAEEMNLLWQISLDKISTILERSLGIQLVLQNQICAVLSCLTCLLCSSTKQSHLTSWLGADCIMITPMDSEVALTFNVFMAILP